MPIIQSQNSNALKSTDNLTPPLSNLHFTDTQSPVQQTNTLHYTDITPISPISLANPLQNTLHPGISFTNDKTNRENEHQVLKITDHAIKPTDTLVLHTDNFLLLNHNPTPIENNSLFQNTFNVSYREENSMPKEEHIDNITTPLITKPISGSEQPDISHATVIKEELFPLSNYQHLYTSAFLPKNNSENTTVVKPSDDTLLYSFTNLNSDQLNQPHLAENTPTNEIVKRTAVKLHEKSNLNGP
jgi:hypothetical protein